MILIGNLKTGSRSFFANIWLGIINRFDTFPLSITGKQRIIIFYQGTIYQEKEVYFRKNKT